MVCLGCDVRRIDQPGWIDLYRHPPEYNAESIRRLIELGNQLTKGLTNVMDHQSYMRQREDLHASSTSIGWLAFDRYLTDK